MFEASNPLQKCHVYQENQHTNFGGPNLQRKWIINMNWATVWKMLPVRHCHPLLSRTAEVCVFQADWYDMSHGQRKELMQSYHLATSKMHVLMAEILHHLDLEWCWKKGEKYPLINWLAEFSAIHNLTQKLRTCSWPFFPPELEQNKRHCLRLLCTTNIYWYRADGLAQLYIPFLIAVQSSKLVGIGRLSFWFTLFVYFFSLVFKNLMSPPELYNSKLQTNISATWEGFVEITGIAPLIFSIDPPKELSLQSWHSLGVELWKNLIL